MTQPRSPLFITIEGGEGAGKSTLVKALNDHFKQQNIPHILTREPGGSRGAEAIRDLLFATDTKDWSPLTQAFLFCAARADHWQKTISPALNSGHIVICDRFLDSTIAYQSGLYGLDESWLRALSLTATENREPDLTFLLDLPVEKALNRLKSRGQNNHFDDFPLENHNKIRAKFLDLAAQYPRRIITLDATQDPATISKEIISHINKRLGV